MLARSFHLNGIVQGVGFRPFVYRLAQRYEIRGWVLNSSEGVFIEAEGEKSALENFSSSLRKEAPPLSLIEEFEMKEIALQGFRDFSIRESSKNSGWTLASPDIVTCPACQEDLDDPLNRRYLYPFTNCTDCGPRLSIIQDLPYDRPKTTMKKYSLCPRCEKEYLDPSDRRFHAQPVCCPHCGPRLLFDFEEENALEKAREALKRGEILALKGIGGYQLALDARNEKAVIELRRRKRRPNKPLALMVKDLSSARKFVHLTPEEEEILKSAAGPIVLARKKEIFSFLAPNLDRLGIMLPSTPLHHLLFEHLDALVMTSGNVSGEPLAYRNQDARERLDHLCDHFLSHDRAIETPIDDSLVRWTKKAPILIRRARGYAPSPIPLPIPIEDGVLAVGGDLKCALGLSKGGRILLSQHIGDLSDPLTFQAFEKILAHYKKLFRIEVRKIVSDLHPAYFSTRWAQEREIPCFAVQHHRAHIAACLAENRVSPKERVIGIAFDGTGFGEDGTSWGGEFFVGALENLERRFHFESMPLPGGDAATKHPCRIAVGFLEEWGIDPAGTLSERELGEQASVIRAMVRKRFNTPLTSSVGRLYDAAASLLGVCQHVSYEGQAAMELEAIAVPSESSYPWKIEGRKIRVGEVFFAMLEDRKKGMEIGVISGRFHRTLAEIAVEICEIVRKEEDLERVALSGGVFQNAFLLEETHSLLSRRNFEPLLHRLVPANDGGLALGQAYLTAIESSKQ